MFFSSIFQDRAAVANLKYFGYKTVTDVLLPLKEMKKRRIWDELFSKEYVKIKDPNELISKDNLTEFADLYESVFSHNLKPSKGIFLLCLKVNTNFYTNNFLCNLM